MSGFTLTPLYAPYAGEEKGSQFVWDCKVDEEGIRGPPLVGDLPASILALQNMSEGKWEVHVNPSAGYDGNDMCRINDGKIGDTKEQVGAPNCATFEVMALVVPLSWLEKRREKQRQEEQRGPAGSSGGAAGQQGGASTTTARQGRTAADVKPAAKQRPRAADGLCKPGGRTPGLDPLVCGWAFAVMVGLGVSSVSEAGRGRGDECHDPPLGGYTGRSFLPDSAQEGGGRPIQAFSMLIMFERGLKPGLIWLLSVRMVTAVHAYAHKPIPHPLLTAHTPAETHICPSVHSMNRLARRGHILDILSVCVLSCLQLSLGGVPPRDDFRYPYGDFYW